MIEFFNNIWMWINEHKDGIMATIMSVEFTAIVTLIVSVWKNVVSNRNNTVSVNSLKTAVADNTVVREDVQKVKAVSEKLFEDVVMLKTAVEDVGTNIENYQCEMENKFNNLFEVLCIVYSTIKDDEIRTTVNAILNSAKYSVNIDKAKLQQENRELKEKLTSLMSFLEGLEDAKKTPTEVLVEDETAKHRRY